MKILIKNATIVNEGRESTGHVLINDELIESVFWGLLPVNIESEADQTIDATGQLLIPGVIDDQVHFREPGLTHKGDIFSESVAAVAGGITSFMEMPNTIPQTTTQELLEQKYQRASEVSAANYSFYMGATNENIREVLKTNPNMVCGIKVFMGSSTGNMLVDDTSVLSELFKSSGMLIAVHCEDEPTIQKNTLQARQRYGENVPFSQHAHIRDAEACYRSSSKAVDLAAKFNTRLHVLHISTAREMGLFASGPVTQKLITAEVCIHHLWFTETDYLKHGSLIKWNPSIKSEGDRSALREALKTDLIDVVATDHAPHTLEEKQNSYFKAPSGGPLVQHALPAMLELTLEGVFSREMVVQKMCHAPAELFGVVKRGFIREGYFADLVLIQPNLKWSVTPANLLYKCGWSPFENESFSHSVVRTWVNGKLVWDKGHYSGSPAGKRLTFDRAAKYTLRED